MESCLAILVHVSNDVACFPDFVDIPDDTLDSFIVSLEFVYRRLVFLEALDETEFSDVLESLRNCLFTFKSACEVRSMSELNFQSQVQPYSAGVVGRPSYIISHEQLSFLIENGFTVPQISDMIGVSIGTVRRRMVEFGLSIRARYSQLTDNELDDIVHGIQVEFPFCGNRQMQGHLLSRGFRVQQIRVRESQLRVDPDGVILRSYHGCILRRRKYSVPSPRSLYYMDGYHKLIRYVTNIIILVIKIFIILFFISIY